MSSLNQAFIKAYGKEPASSKPSATATVATETPVPVTSPAPAGNVLGSWYSAETWYRAEAAQPAVAKSSAPIPPPHASFSAGYQAPSTSDLSQLAGHQLSRRVGSVDEEIEYRLSPVEIVVDEDVIVPKAVVSETIDATAVPVEVATPKAMPVAPVVSNSTQVANAFALHDMFVPVQIGGAWDEGWAALPPVSTLETTPVAKPIAKVDKPAVVEKPVAKAPVSPEKPIAKPAPPAPPVTQVRLDAAVSPPVPKPHVGITPPVAAPAAAPKVSAPAPTPVPAPVAKVAPPAPAPVPTPAPAVAPKSLGPLQPAWEVDRFQWPDHCRQLMSPENESMSDVGQRLAIAAKDGLSILAITSTRRGEGRTTLALCLAKAAAAAGVKVALVDADGDNPQLVNELGVEAAAGWHDVVLGKQPLSETAILSLEDRFTFFPWTTVGAIKSLNDPQATKVLKAIASEHQLVILDLGPAPGRETKMFEDGEQCPIDAVILVRDVRWTSAIEAQRVAGQLLSAGVGSVGIAENFGPRT